MRTWPGVDVTSYFLESREEWCGNYVILHHAIFFSLLMTIFNGIKVVPLKTLTVLRIYPRDAK